MKEFWDLAGWPVIFVTACAGAYFIYLKPTLERIAATTGKSDTIAATAGFKKILAVVEGWKTLILSGMLAAIQVAEGVINQLDPVTLDQLKALPWANAFTQETANRISLVLAAAIPFTHLMGVNKAAATPPKE